MQNYSHDDDDDWLCKNINDIKKDKARGFEVRATWWAKAALETAFGFSFNGGYEYLSCFFVNFKFVLSSLIYPVREREREKKT